MRVEFLNKQVQRKLTHILLRAIFLLFQTSGVKSQLTSSLKKDIKRLLQKQPTRRKGTHPLFIQLSFCHFVFFYLVALSI